ncbi:transglycosylase SLT domain-containing protein [Billgrantia ethanolica]|uniref:Transglycosylase SLT domain-containing protein n=1 Tax=Billgrantia ethanolica TaxID=2733486 RepID=A0ABS9A8Z3_9GAMM|nr:transglycosylase SLT domain-containing protein [Halomonas ethanolica]MCE8005311.1 transglycosylase SLT domain-containing protein [Halomonas ethanolica]
MCTRRSLTLFVSWAVSLWLWLMSASSVAGTDVPRAYVLAAQSHGVPPEVLYAVATTESAVTLEHGRRPWPWTLNVAGRGYYFATRDEACEALTRSLFETTVIDVGIAQLNYRWQPQLFGAGTRFVDPCDALDPYANLDEAARLLRSHFDASGDWLVAAGRYHRPAGGAPAARYRREVAANLARLEYQPDQVLTTATTQFSTVEELQVPSVTAPQSNPTRVHVPAEVPITIDRSLVWVVPMEPVSWIDPEVRWDRLVAAH